MWVVLEIVPFVYSGTVAGHWTWVRWCWFITTAPTMVVAGGSEQAAIIQVAGEKWPAPYRDALDGTGRRVQRTRMAVGVGKPAINCGWLSWCTQR